MRRHRPVRAAAALAALIVAALTAAPASADTVRLTVKEGRSVVDPASGVVIADENAIVTAPYTWLLTRDVTGDPDDGAADCRPGHGLTAPAAVAAAYDAAAYPARCDWPSIHAIGPGTAPSVERVGDGGGWNAMAGLTDLAPGTYMVSVWADGYEVSGGWFEVTGDPGRTITAVVHAQRNPVPTATLRIDVFADDRPTNGQYDVGSEQGLNGFRAIAADPGTGEALTTDVYGNPICSDYEPVMTRRNGQTVPVLDGDGLTIYQLFDEAGDPVFDSYAPNGTLIPGSHTGWETAAPRLIPGTGGQCLSHSLTLTDPETGDTYQDPGHVVIRNLGPGRWAAMVSPPENPDWASNPASYDPAWSQTTTLEGAHDWDTWLVAGDNGLDHEFVNGSEKTAITMSGWVRKGNDLPAAAAGQAGTISGTVVETFSYTADPVAGNYIGQNEQSLQNEVGPVDELWVGLTALHVPAESLAPGESAPTQDQLIWARSFFDRDPANPLPAGEFSIPSVPAGDYLLTVWDFDQNNILHMQNVTVRPGETTDVDTMRLAQWWTWVHGTVFDDANANGRQDPGEHGIPDQLVTVRERSNALYNHGSIAATTDEHGHYTLRSVYPLGQWLVLEQYSDGYKTTGVTWQAAHEKTPTTRTGGAVDLNVLPWIGQGATIDWGKQAYGSAENGGIVGVVAYGTTRNELDPEEAALEDWQPGLPGVTVHLYRAVKDANGDPVLNPDGSVQVEGQNPDGSGTPRDIAPAQETEQWQRPVDCPSFDADGNRVSYPFLHDFGAFGLNLAPGGLRECVEAIGGGMKVGEIPDGAGGVDWGATVNGNWGFGEQYIDPGLPAGTGPGQLDDPANLEPLPAGDYVVKVDIPTDAHGVPVYKVTREEDVNVFAGDAFQQPSPAILLNACAGANHLVDVADVGVDGPDATPNPTFAENGGSPFEGQQRPLCDAKLIHLENGRSVAPGFELFTDTPLPTIHYGLIIDDLNTSVSDEEIFYGDKAPARGMPISWYDFSGRLVRQTHTDPNGFYEVMLPSTNRINYPSPAGVAPGSFTLVANDPSMPDPAAPDPDADDENPRPVVPNPRFDPQYRTITTPFETWAGHTTITDLAVWTIGVAVAGPGAQLAHPAQCLLDTTSTPQLFAADRVYANRPANPATWAAADRTFTLRGTGFGTSGTIQLANETAVVNGVGTAVNAPAVTVTSWTPGAITFRLQTATLPGPYQLYLTNGTSGERAINAVTLHVRGSAPGASYTPTVYEVGPGRTYDPNLTPLRGHPTAVTATTLTATGTDFTGLVGRHVEITSGPGTGLVRRITAVEAGGSRIVVDASFGPPPARPTTASTFSVARARGIQDAIDAAVGIEIAPPTTGEPEDAEPITLTGGQRLVVVYPNPAGAKGFNPKGAYLENLIIPAPLTLQGVGPGGQGSGSYVHGSVIDGSTFQVADGGAYKTRWYTRALAVADAAGGRAIADGSVIYVLTRAGLFGAPGAGRAAIDGLAIEGGDQMAFPGTLNQLGGGPVPRRLRTLGAPVTQGGGVFVDGDARRLQIRNNAFRSNGGAYGGAIRLGTPYLGPDGNASNGNADIRIAGNQIIASGGTNLAGGIAIFNGADNYEIARNEICGNFSAEYGGGISHYGRSDGGRIHHNRIYFNASYDEAGGILIAGQLPAPKEFPNLPPAADRTQGSGAVEIDANVVQSNLANDDGGGIRLLMTGPDPIRITNNQITNNIAAHEGGAIALDDATDVVVAGNTVMKNITTATAMTSDGTPAPAGLATAANSSWLTQPPADDTCLVPLGGRVASVTSIGGGLLNQRRRITVQGAASQLAPYVGVAGLTITVTHPTNPSPAATRPVQSIDAVNGRIDLPFALGLPNLTANFATWRFTLNVPASSATFPSCVPPQADFTPPVVFDNIFWDNRAGSYDGGMVHGIGLAGDVEPVNHWDMGAIGVAAGSDLLPVANVIQDLTGPHGDFSGNGNTSVDPAVGSSYDTTVLLAPFRGDPHFVAGTIVAVDVPPTRMGNYHLTAASPRDDGVRCVEVATGSHQAAPSCVPAAGGRIVALPAYDIDDDARPQGGTVDRGADEYLASAPIVAARGTTTRLKVSAGLRTTRRPAAARSLVGGRAPERITASCRRCVASLQYRPRRGGRTRTIAMRRHGTRFVAASRRLPAGAYRVRVVIRNRQTGRVHRSAWRTVTIKPNHRKGTR